MFSCCAWVYILKFCHLKEVRGVVDARKWSAKWSNWNISDIFFCLSSIEGRKQRKRPETLAPCMGTIPSEGARQENDFVVLRRIFWHYWYATFRKTFVVWRRSFKHINPQLSMSVYSKTGKCDELWPFPHRATFAFNWQGSKIEYMGTACSEPKPQKSAGGHMCISACSLSIGSWTTPTFPDLYLY